MASKAASRRAADQLIDERFDRGRRAQMPEARAGGGRGIVVRTAEFAVRDFERLIDPHRIRRLDRQLDHAGHHGHEPGTVAPLVKDPVAVDDQAIAAGTIKAQPLVQRQSHHFGCGAERRHRAKPTHRRGAGAEVVPQGIDDVVIWIDLETFEAHPATTVVGRAIELVSIGRR